LSVRRLEARDIAAVLEIQSACPEIAQWSENSYRRVAEGGMAGWVSEDERGVTGFLVAQQLVRETEVLNLAVRAHARGQGIGRKLIDAAIEWSRGLGAEKVMLEVRESNAVAIRFYERRGFVIVGRRPGYYKEPVEDGLMLSCVLAAR